MNWDAKPLDEEAVIQMARANLSVGRLVRTFKTSREQILAILARHGMTPAVTGTPRRDISSETRTAEDFMYRVPTGKPNPMSVARHVFGTRLAETDACLKLDGRPISLNDLMRKVNAQHVLWGESQIDTNPAWRI